MSRLEVRLREELLDARDADGAGAAAGHVVVLLQAGGAIVQGPNGVRRTRWLEYLFELGKGLQNEG